MILGVPFYLFGYKRGCWVTAIDPRLQNLEFGYSYLAATADCIHKCVIFQRAKTVYQFCPLTQRISSMDRASLLRREGCGFESRMRVFRCLVQRFALTQWCQGFVFTKVSRQFSARKLAVLTLLKGFSLFIAAQFLNPHDRSRYPWNR